RPCRDPRAHSRSSVLSLDVGESFAKRVRGRCDHDLHGDCSNEQYLLIQGLAHALLRSPLGRRNRDDCASRAVGDFWPETSGLTLRSARIMPSARFALWIYRESFDGIRSAITQTERK